MIYLECYGDKSLLTALGVPKKLLKHSHGRSNVCRAVKDNAGAIGMVDEDPQQAPDAFMATLQTSSNTRFLKVLMDRSSGRRLIVIRPNLEKWVISVTREIERTEAVEGLLQTYYLPATFRDLHDALNIQGRPNQHFIRMISELKARSSVLQSLADMLGIT